MRAAIPVLIGVLDGRGDLVGLREHEDPSERYVLRAGDLCNTRDLMEAKLWCCRILGVIGSLRADIRLSCLLDAYRSDFDAGVYAASDSF